MAKKSVLITGCNESGLAREFVNAYLKRGYQVLATHRNMLKIGKLGELSNVTVLQLDVASVESIARCVAEVQKITGGTLDVLVNNAGSGGVMPLLDADIAEAKMTYDINVWGLLAVTQAFAPLLIRAQGAICNISSVLGEMVYAWQGIYGSSRSAATLISETLGLEMAPLGVQVSTVILGGVATAQNDTNNRPDLQLPPASYYEPIASAINRHQKMLIFVKKQEAHVAAENIVKDVLEGHKSIIRRGEGSTMSWIGKSFMSHAQFTAMLNKESGLDGLA